MAVRVLIGDCREVLAQLPEASVHSVVTSPPYWSLRNYEVEPTVWGGDPDHEHAFGQQLHGPKRGNPNGGKLEGSQPAALSKSATDLGAFCDCGAWCGALGLEPTPELYVEHLVQALREVRRVLRDDGTLWLNLGDSFVASGRSHAGEGLADWSARLARGGGHKAKDACRSRPRQPRHLVGLRHKELIGIPWMVAFALRADGWLLRMEVIWSKPNPVPESVRDRPAKSHEQLFLLTKNGRYYYDAEAVKEPTSSGREARWDNGHDGHGGGESHAGQGSSTRKFGSDPRLRNRRSVWTVPTEPYGGAHFATFPPALVEPCILAGTSARGVCPDCGSPWRRIVERVPTGYDGSTYGERQVAATGGAIGGGTKASTLGSSGGQLVAEYRTVGWGPSCNHSGQADDLELIASPTGSGGGTDPSIVVGRAGMARPRATDEGQRLMHRWQQRDYARQLRESPFRQDMALEAGPAFAHYIRTDRTGARPVPPDLLDDWLERGWLFEPVWLDAEVPPKDPVPATVLDPFGGSGTAAMVADRHGRDAIVIELNPEYESQIQSRLALTPRAGNRPDPNDPTLPLWDAGAHNGAAAGGSQ